MLKTKFVPIVIYSQKNKIKLATPSYQKEKLELKNLAEE